MSSSTEESPKSDLDKILAGVLRMSDQMAEIVARQNTAEKAMQDMQSRFLVTEETLVQLSISRRSSRNPSKAGSPTPSVKGDNDSKPSSKEEFQIEGAKKVSTKLELSNEKSLPQDLYFKTPDPKSTGKASDVPKTLQKRLQALGPKMLSPFTPADEEFSKVFFDKDWYKTKGKANTKDKNKDADEEGSEDESEINVDSHGTSGRFVRNFTKWDPAVTIDTCPPSIFDILANKESMEQYYFDTGDVPKWGQCLSREVRSQILAEYIGIPDGNFFLIQEKFLFMILIAMASPKSKPEFEQLLEQFQCSPSFKNLDISTENVDQLAACLSRHIANFMTLLNALLQNNKELCPPAWTSEKNPCTGKQVSKCLVGILLRSFPHDLGNTFYYLFPHYFDKKGTFEKFVASLRDLVSELKNYMSVVYPHVLLINTSRRFKRASKPTKKEKYVKNSHRLAYIAERSDEDDSSSEQGASVSDDESVQTSSDHPDIDNNEVEYYAFMERAVKKDSTGKLKTGCFKFINSKCTDPKCKYSHREEDLKTARDFMLKQATLRAEYLKNWKYNASPKKLNSITHVRASSKRNPFIQRDLTVPQETSEPVDEDMEPESPRA